MTQKSLTPEKVEELRSLRAEGLNVREVATKAGVSGGAVSNYTRDIAKPARAPVVKKEGENRSKGILTTTYRSQPSDSVVALANRVRREELEEELDSLVERRRQRAATGGEARDMPTWTRDPIEFIKTINLISGEGKGKGDEGVKIELNELRRSLAEFREQRHQAQLAGLQGELTQQSEQHQREMGLITDRMNSLIKGRGRSELDVLHTLVTGALTEAKEARAEVVGVMKAGQLPQAKSEAEKQNRKQRYRGQIENDSRIEFLVRKLYLGQPAGPAVHTAPLAPKPKSPGAQVFE